VSEPQVLVQALAGSARLPDIDGIDGDDATQAADEACRLAEGWLRPVAMTAAGWVALRGGERVKADRLAQASVSAAREEQSLGLLADALELAASCAEDPDEARRMLTEALSVWRTGGAVPRAHQVAVLLGRLPHADSGARSAARVAARELQRLGITHVYGVPVSARVGAAPVAVEVLGGFRVLVDESEVPAAAWRSRQARTLIKILAARHGRPTSRAWLCETLWPDDDPAKTGHRLSVLLTTLRGVLDPHREWPADRFVVADSDGVWLDRTSVAVDAVTLVRDAESAAALMDAGEVERAREILADVNDRYRGDAFEDEQSEVWADGAREEVRAAWQRSVRRLAALARRAGRIGDAQALLVRLLTVDPYDERIHELLVRNLLTAGRRGEARRAFERWSAAMLEIGAPAPDVAILHGRPAHRSRATHRPRSTAVGAVLTPF
jgi:DNA-binding SARP family transcriptional activator